jgi:hypothetical protein
MSLLTIGAQAINVFTYLNTQAVNNIMIKTLNEVREEFKLADDSWVNVGHSSTDIMKY